MGMGMSPRMAWSLDVRASWGWEDPFSVECKYPADDL